jgi:hypothetical protein
MMDLGPGELFLILFVVASALLAARMGKVGEAVGRLYYSLRPPKPPAGSSDA